MSANAARPFVSDAANELHWSECMPWLAGEPAIDWQAAWAMPYDARRAYIAGRRIGTTPTVASILRDGRARIERGWLSGAACEWLPVAAVVFDDDGATRINEESRAALMVLSWAVGASGVRLWNGSHNTPVDYETGLVFWNDSGERTREDVLALFDRAIAYVENEAST